MCLPYLNLLYSASDLCSFPTAVHYNITTGRDHTVPISRSVPDQLRSIITLPQQITSALRPWCIIAPVAIPIGLLVMFSIFKVSSKFKEAPGHFE